MKQARRYNSSSLHDTFKMKRITRHKEGSVKELRHVHYGMRSTLEIVFIFLCKYNRLSTGVLSTFGTCRLFSCLQCRNVIDKVFKGNLNLPASARINYMHISKPSNEHLAASTASF